jgi:hypothetical protein
MFLILIQKSLFSSQTEFQIRNNLDTTQTLVGDLCPEESEEKLSSLGKKLIDQKRKQLEKTIDYEALLNSNQPKYVTNTFSQFIKFKKQQKIYNLFLLY